MEDRMVCDKCGKPIDAQASCYQLRVGSFEEDPDNDGELDFQAAEDVGYYHEGCSP